MEESCREGERDLPLIREQGYKLYFVGEPGDRGKRRDASCIEVCGRSRSTTFRALACHERAWRFAEGGAPSESNGGADSGEAEGRSQSA